MTSRSWLPKGTKPSTDRLRAEIVRRGEVLQLHPQPRPNHWTWQHCVDWLGLHEPELNTGSNNGTSEAQLQPISSTHQPPRISVIPTSMPAQVSSAPVMTTVPPLPMMASLTQEELSSRLQCSLDARRIEDTGSSGHVASENPNQYVPTSVGTTAERTEHLIETSQQREFEMTSEHSPVRDEEVNITPVRSSARESVTVGLQFGYGGRFDSSTPETPRSCESPAVKANWSKLRCVPRMANVFVVLKEEFLLRDTQVPRFILDAKDHDWFWRLAAEEFNKPNSEAVNYNLFRDEEAYPEEVRKLDPFYRPGYVVTAAKLKAEFRDLRALFTKAFSNFRQSGMGEKDSDRNEGHDDEEDVEKAFVFSSNFFDFCNGDNCIYYFYCCCTKYDLLKSAVVTMPEGSQHDGASTSKLVKVLGKRRAVAHNETNRTAEALIEASKMPLEIRRSEKEEMLIDARTRLTDSKRQKSESETYRNLLDQYMELVGMEKSTNLPHFIRKTNRTRMTKLEIQLTKLAAVSQADEPIEEGSDDNEDDESDQ